MNFEKIKNGANYDGYGIDENGVDKDKNDLDSRYYEEKDVSTEEEYKPGQFASEVAEDIKFEKNLKKLSEQRGKTSMKSALEIDSDQLEDIKTASSEEISSKKIEERKEEDKIQYIGKDGFVYDNRQDAIDSFID